jgi:hypothetical protein
VSSVTSGDAPQTSTLPTSTLPTGWPVRRTPRWLLLAAIPVLAVAIAVSLAHSPTRAERASDLRGYLQALNTDVESCAGGVRESLTALRLVEAENWRSASDVSDGISVAEQGAANCGPAANEQIDDLENYQAPESLDGFGLVAVVTSLVDWVAPDAQNVETGVAKVLAAPSPPARARAQAELTVAIERLNGKRAAVNGPIRKAIAALGAQATPLNLPG